jgi:hypothetical protein
LRKRGIFVSPSGVRSVWLRHDLESFKKRLSALERHVAETGEVLTEAQVVALEKKQEDDVAYGRLKRPTQVIWEVRIRFTWAQLKALGAFINRRLSIPIPSMPPRNFTRRKRQLLQQTCLMTVSAR